MTASSRSPAHQSPGLTRATCRVRIPGMDDERWEALVRRLEPEARARPAAYRRKVVLLALLGYAFIATLLLVLVGLGVLVVVLAFSSSGIVLKFLIPIGAL